jgi:two-component system chemotaxis sensor kinase CheA
MAGFDFSELLPFYLDETDEHISGLNEMLLQLEQEPSNPTALREAFRLVHSIKGSSAVMGFSAVKELTHHLETFFDQIRAGQRTLERSFLDLCFRCLDALRDTHAELRATGRIESDLAELTAQVIARLEGKTPSEEPTPVATPQPEPPVAPEPASPDELGEATNVVTVRVTLEPNVPWPDMKARLVLTRLGTKGRVLGSAPPADRLEELTSPGQFTVWMSCEGDIGQIHELADVEGVASIDVSTPPLAGDLTPEPRAGGIVTEAAIEPIAPPKRTPVPPVEDLNVPPAPSAPAPAQPGAKEPRRARVAETVRVDADRLDHLMNLAGELVINKARFSEIARGFEEVFRGSNADLLAADTRDRLDFILSSLDDGEGTETHPRSRWAAQFRRLRENVGAILDQLDQVRQGRERLAAMSEAIHHLGRVSDSIQKGVLETRMVPIGPLFDRFQRVVRDLRLSSGKEVALKIEGEKTELDKRMIDELSDPLVHLVRNSVDHGLELPEEREAAGKPRSGTVLLAASHRGNSVVITVGDDGRGIDCARVRAKAVTQGLITEDEAHRLSDRQVVSYIFHPGLSTADRITEVSGRGVGMDVVKSRIEDLSGALDVRSEPGVGTTFLIRLPLTLAIMPVLLARIGCEAYAIPLDHLAEIVEVPRRQVYLVQGRRSIKVRGQIIALMTLHEMFGWANGADSGPEAEKQIAVIVSDGESTVGLVVDHLLGMQEAVLKSLEKNYQPVPGLCGASILGDGRVSLILDVDALIRMAAIDAVPVPA